jgi:hypothetical protein
MGFIDNMFKGNGRYPKSVFKSVTQSADVLNTIVNESIQLASNATDLTTKKSRLDYAMKKLVELIKLANEYSFLDFRKISSIYDSIREVRNEIREMELNKGQPVGQDSAESPDGTGIPVEKKSTFAKTRDLAVCPYCSYQFPVMPQRKVLCPSCNKTIYVWYSTTQNMKKLVTEEEALNTESEISGHIEKYELLNKQETLEKTEDEVKMVQAELKETDPKATLDDAYLFLLNGKIKKTRNNSEKSRLHYLKAMLLDNSGQEFSADLIESKKLELLNLKTHNFVRKVQIITNQDSCKVCKADSDKILTIEEALEKMPLPHINCNRTLYSEKGFCRCNYLIINE